MNGPSTFTGGLGFTPLYRIERGGDDLTSTFSDRATSISVTLFAGNSNGDLCEIVMDDRDFALASPSTSGEGAANLSIFMGYEQGGLYDLGSYQIGQVRYTGLPKSMTLVGSSYGFNTAVKAPVITSYDGKTLGDIVGAIAQAAGVQPYVDPTLASKLIPFLNQHASSLHLLQELERRFDALAKFSNGTLAFAKRGSGDSQSGTFLGGFVLEPEDLAEWDVQESERTAYSKVRASFFDKSENQLRWVVSSVAGAPNATAPFVIKKALNSKDEAQAAADAHMGALNRGTHTGRLTLVKGDPSITGGQAFRIARMRSGLDGDYTVTSVTHAFTQADGISTSIEFEDADPSATADLNGLDETCPRDRHRTGPMKAPKT